MKSHSRFTAQLIKKLKDNHFEIQQDQQCKLVEQYLKQKNPLELSCNATPYELTKLDSNAIWYLAKKDSVPIGALAFISPTKNKPKLPIESYLSLLELAPRSKTMELLCFRLNQINNSRSYCTAMIACCYLHSKQNKIDYCFVNALNSSEYLLKKVGFKAIDTKLEQFSTKTLCTPKMIIPNQTKTITKQLAKALQEEGLIK